MPRALLLLCLLVLASGCDDGLAKPSARDVDARVSDATERLNASEAGRLVLASIDAHGGLEAWYAGGPLRFRYAYTRLDSVGMPSAEPPLDTRQTVDAWAARATHTLAADSTVRFGWTGTQAWAMPSPEALPTDARFWSLTPYYFVGMPFVLADPGVNLEMAEPLALDSTTTLEQVYVTFDAGTGDAPDDYYYLLLDPETKRVAGVRYVVSYGPFNPDGGHTPETIMLYDGAQTVGGITLQEGFRSFLWDGTGAGTPKARGTLTEFEFAPEVTNADFAAPPEATVLPDLDA
ncbi:hypothetical protein [Rubricoccus marinus]|nr:hypothetical protein [Rubricoccus marinus]